MHKACFLLLSFCLTSPLFATNQVPEKLIYDEMTYQLDFKIKSNYLMAPYFASHPDAKPSLPTEIIPQENGMITRSTASRSTGCLRGYVSTYAFVDKKLILKDITIRNAKREAVSVMHQLTPEDKPFFIPWFTGILTAELYEAGSSKVKTYLFIQVKEGEFVRALQLSADDQAKLMDLVPDDHFANVMTIPNALQNPQSKEEPRKIRVHYKHPLIFQDAEQFLTPPRTIEE